MFFFFPDEDSNAITANRAFEVFVLSVLRDYLQTIGKVILYTSDTSSLGFDAFAPNGINDSIPTYIEVKHFGDNKGQYFKSIKENNIFRRLNLGQYKIILIIGTEFEFISKIQMANLVSSRAGTKAEVWDYNDLKALVGPIFDNYYDAHSTPSKFLVKSAINERETDIQRKLQKESILSFLKQSYQKEKFVLVLGAGVSQSAGVPTWSDLIIHLQTSMILHLLQDKRTLTGQSISQIIQLASTTFESSPISQMRFVRSALSPEEYNGMVHNSLYINRPTSKTTLLDAICTICKPDRTRAWVDSIITYNFDDLLERALSRFKIDYKVVSQEKDNSSINDLNIFHAHGYLPKRVEDFSANFGLIFSEEDYHQVYKDAYCWSNLIQINSFRDKTCVFIGNSLTDPNLRRLLDISSRQEEQPHHFAFLKRIRVARQNGISDEAFRIYQEIDENLKNSYYKTLGINIIWVDEFEEIPVILLSLKQS